MQALRGLDESIDVVAMADGDLVAHPDWLRELVTPLVQHERVGVVTGNRWFNSSALPRSAGGLIKANHHCKVETMSRVYVAGDSGSFPGPEWMPKQAHMADLQAVAAAKNLVGELNGTATDATF